MYCKHGHKSQVSQLIWNRLSRSVPFHLRQRQTVNIADKVSRGSHWAFVNKVLIICVIYTFLYLAPLDRWIILNHLLYYTFQISYSSLKSLQSSFIKLGCCLETLQQKHVIKLFIIAKTLYIFFVSLFAQIIVLTLVIKSRYASHLKLLIHSFTSAVR